MNERPVPAILALLAIGLLGFFVFPGHTYLHQDSQIYLPMMERLADSRLLSNDLIASYPHLSFTCYDEITVTLAKLTRLDMQAILVAQQLLTRLLGIFGVFLLAQSAGLTYSAAVLVAAIYSFGATILGPSILTVEYEPTPRSFALPLILLAAGLASLRHWSLAGAAAFAAVLYHPPTAAPVLFLMLLFVSSPWNLYGRWKFFAWIAAAAIVLFAAAKYQAGVRLEQDFFSHVSPAVDKLQRMRASYVFVGIWFSQYAVHHFFLFAVALAAWWRIGPRLDGFARFFLLALPVLGLLSLFVSYLTTDLLTWSLAPQLQPARAVLWTTFAAIVSCGMAAGLANGIGERALWLLLPFAVVIQVRPLDLLWPATPSLLQHLALVCLLALLAAFSLRLDAWAPALLIALAMYLILHVAGVRNYPSIHSEELDQLSAWARAETPLEAVFHFPDAAKELYPGIFRARAKRAVWVDWKGGGQVNFMEPLALEWSRRWNALPAGSGDYLVRKQGKCGPHTLFANAKFCVESH